MSFGGWSKVLLRGLQNKCSPKWATKGNQHHKQRQWHFGYLVSQVERNIPNTTVRTRWDFKGKTDIGPAGLVAEEEESWRDWQGCFWNQSGFWVGLLYSEREHLLFVVAWEASFYLCIHQLGLGIFNIVILQVWDGERARDPDYQDKNIDCISIE